jgi:DNA-binding GntR family transcriptional regulator
MEGAASRFQAERVYSGLAAETQASVREPVAIIEATQRGDAPAAEQATKRNRMGAADRLLRVIARALELGGGWSD